MIVITTVPLIISSLLMAAHLYRYGSTYLAASCLLLLLLLLVKNRWTPRLFSAVMLAYAIEWLRTLTVYIRLYSENGQPLTRLAVILGSVELITLLSILVFKTKAMKQRYNLSG